MARSVDKPDPINTPIQIAREMAFRQVQRFLAEMPNPIGRVPRGRLRDLTLKEIKRLARGG